MRNVYKILAFVLAAEVLVQAMAIAYAIAGLGYWISEEGGVLNKAAMDSDSLDFNGIGGFMTHGINGMMVIPLVTLLLLITSFFAKVPGGVKRAAIIFGLVVLQVFLGILSHSIPYAIMLHALNAFGIFSMALFTGWRAREVADVRVGATAAV